jgi:hypothetical protein
VSIIFFWFALSVVVWIVASSNGRTGFGYFLLSLLFSPLLVGIVVLCLGKSPERRKAELVALATAIANANKAGA